MISQLSRFDKLKEKYCRALGIISHISLQQDISVELSKIPFHTCNFIIVTNTITTKGSTYHKSY